MNVKKAILLVMPTALPHILVQGTPKQYFWIKISNKCFHWFPYNHLKANPGKCHLLLSSKTPTYVSIVDASLKTSTKETLLGIFIDSKLSFDQQVSSICGKASKKLHALGPICYLQVFLENVEHMKRKQYWVSIQLLYPNMNVHSRIMNNKINRIYEKALRLVYSDHVSSFDELITWKRQIIFYSSQEHSKSSYWTLQVFSWSFSKYHEKCLPS